jgi:putative ABC transport system permease protein
MLFGSILKESFLFAYHALVSNKLRTILSLLGITIGIFAIISVFTVIDSLEKNIRTSVASLGENVVFIQKWPWEFGKDYPWWKYMNRPVPAVVELPELQRRSQYAEAMTFTINANNTVKYENNSIENINITCVSHDYNKVKTFELQDGRYFTEMESTAGRNIAVIGDNVAQSLFGGKNPIGESIKIIGRKITVIGIFKKEGSSIVGKSLDDMVLIPINYARNIVDLRSERLDPMVMIRAKKGINNEALKSELTGIMRSIRKLKPLADDDFALNETSMLSKGFDPIFDIIGLAGWIIGGFSIIVGGFGIANIMFVSVKERTSLIGIQKSLGAKNYFILTQFLIESVLLSLLGGLIGLLLVFIIAFLINLFADLGIMLNQSNVILAITVSVLIGVISGFVPAYTASQLDPVEAMRS